MAGNDELGKFVRKFVSLWQSGSNARLHVDSEAVFAHVSLQVDLGQAKLCVLLVSMDVVSVTKGLAQLSSAKESKGNQKEKQKLLQNKQW